jgi:hypothetical protein
MAMGIYEATKRMRKNLIRVVDKKVIVCVSVVSSECGRFEYDGSFCNVLWLTLQDMDELCGIVWCRAYHVILI